MKLSRFLFGVGAGFLTGYWLYRRMQPEMLKPEEVIRRLKEQHQHDMPIVGSWIEVEPTLEQVGDMTIRTYQCGLTGLLDGAPQRFYYKVDAYNGNIIEVEA